MRKPPIDQKATDAAAIRAALERGDYIGAYRVYRPGWAAFLGDMPSQLVPGIVRHVLAGGMVGGFLYSVLENDLMEAMGRADMVNRNRMFDITRFLFNYTPRLCHGSTAKVKAWQAEGGELSFTYDNADLKGETS